MFPLGSFACCDSAVVKRSVRISGQPTSVSLEAPFWQALKAIATQRGVSMSFLLSELDASRCGEGNDSGKGFPVRGNLSSMARVYALLWFQSRAGEYDERICQERSEIF